MQKLLQATEQALGNDESNERNVQQRADISDALRLLREHQAGLVKAYPMALLEIFAEGPGSSQAQPASATGMDFGELSLMDDAQVQAQVEFSRAQQLAVHATDASLGELNALVSAAQGLRSVQPERNPLRPDNYIRALQQVVGDCGVASGVRQLWMRYLRDPLGALLTQEYQWASEALRSQGVQPVGYAVLAAPGARHSVQGGAYASGLGSGLGSGYGTLQGAAHGTGYGGYSGHSGHSGHAPLSAQGPLTGWDGGAYQAAQAQEALLTASMLRQMLAAQVGLDSRLAPVSLPGDGGASVQASLNAALASPMAASASAQSVLQDMAEIERMVGQLAQVQAQQVQAQQALLHAPASRAAPLAWRPSALAPAGSPAQEVVSRMVAHLVQEARLLPSVQRAVRSLEPALQQLVRHDASFFKDAQHPARRLLDEITERSRTFEDENASGFSRFMRVVDEAVVHLGGHNVADASPFASVLTALQAAWQAQAEAEQTRAQALRDKQAAREKARAEAKERALRLVAQRAKLAAKIAAGIRKLADTGEVPPDILEFVTGPWAEVVALAHINAPDAGGDPGGYLALVPDLLWSVQPSQLRQDPEHLHSIWPGVQETLRRGLHSIGRPQEQAEEWLQRLQAIHAQLLALPTAPAAPAAVPEAPSASEVQAAGLDLDLTQQAPPLPEARDPHPEFQVGIWVEIISKGHPMRSQLTWASPHKTLFLFTAPDGSTQSMTRRMRDKLLAEGGLRVVA